jgi:hypothetical protein
MFQFQHYSQRSSQQAILVVLAVLANSFSPAGRCSARTVAAQDAIVIVQRHSSLGQVVTTVGKSGIRIELPKQQCVIVGAPPEWKMTLFNAGAKTKFEQSFNQLGKNSMFLEGDNGTRYRAKIIQTSKTSTNGIPVIVREAAADFKLESEPWDRTQVGVDRRNVKRMYFLGYDDKTKCVPEKATQFLNSIYGFPPYLGLVIGLRYRFANGQVASVIEPYSVKFRATNRGDFAVPSGLRLTQLKMEVLSAGVSNLVEGWADEMGLGEDEDRRDRSKKKSK